MNFYFFRGEGIYVGNVFDFFFFDFWVFKIFGNVECIYVGNRIVRVEYGIFIFKFDFVKYFVNDYFFYQGEYRGYFVGVQVGIYGFC